MSDVPFFSIIIPVYNKEPYIHNTLASVLNQSFKDYEIIFIGGGSTDNSDIICKDYVSKYPNKCIFIEQSGKGAAIARNDGILHARADYIAFLDADDIWTNEYLMYMYQLICDFPQAIFYCGGQRWVYPDGFKTNRIMPCERGIINYFQMSMDYDGLGIITSWIVYKKDRLMKIGMFKKDFVIGEDADLATRMALEGEVAYEPKNCGIYLAELPNSLCKYSRGFIVHVPAEEELLHMEKLHKQIEHSEMAKCLRAYRERWILSTVLQNLDRGNKDAARAQLDRVTKGYVLRRWMLKRLVCLPTPICLWLHNMYNKYIWRKKWEGDRE